MNGLSVTETDMQMSHSLTHSLFPSAVNLAVNLAVNKNNVNPAITITKLL